MSSFLHSLKTSIIGSQPTDLVDVEFDEAVKEWKQQMEGMEKLKGLIEV